MDLNGETIPRLNNVYLGQRFHGGYILGGAYQKGFGLYDREGNTVVPLAFETEAEAWAQVGMREPTVEEEYPDLAEGYPELDGACRPAVNEDGLYGYESGDGGVLVDYQFDEGWHFSDRWYTYVKKDGRCGLLKHPLQKSVMSGWAAAEVDAALDAGLVPARCAGYYTFEISRSQLAALLVTYCEKTQGRELPLPGEHPFRDTQDAYIEKAYAAGIVQGVGDGAFAPDKVVTREQMAAMLYRTVKDTDPAWSGSVPAPTGYEDLDRVSGWAVEAVSAMLAHGVMRGVSDTRIAPKSFCTTEQAILLVSRLAEG